MKVVEFEPCYTDGLSELILEYFEEIHPTTISPTPNPRIMIEQALEQGRTIYILLDDNDIPIGFTMVGISDQYGMTISYIFVEYMYVCREHRSTLASAHLFTMIGRICEDYGLDALAHTNVLRLKGEPIATTFIYPNEDVVRVCKRYEKRLHREKKPWQELK